MNIERIAMLSVCDVMDTHGQTETGEGVALRVPQGKTYRTLIENGEETDLLCRKCQCLYWQCEHQKEIEREHDVLTATNVPQNWAWLLEYGFKIESTGGGCQWFNKQLGNGLSLTITDGEAELPDTTAQMFLMTARHSEPLMHTELMTADQMRDVIEQGLESEFCR